MVRNAAVNVRVVDWGVNKVDPHISWVDLEFTGSFQDDNGQVVFNEPEPKRVTFDLHPETSSKNKTVQPKYRSRLDPRQSGPI